MVRNAWLGLAAAVALAGCGHVAKEVGPGEVVTVDGSESVNGDLECNGGMVSVLPGASINGDILANDCTLKIAAPNNGDIIATGGALLTVRDASTVNGAIEAVGVARVAVTDSVVNGGLDIEGSYEVTVTGSYFNGAGSIVGVVDVYAVDNDFNGDFEIYDTERCEAADNTTNGDLAVAGCD